MSDVTEQAFNEGKLDGIDNEFGRNNYWKTEPHSLRYNAYIRGYNEGKESVAHLVPDLHIDDWLDDGKYSVTAEEAYARWWFEQRRWPAAKQLLYRLSMKQFKLFCTYEGKRYRVTGCSRLGDVWLNVNWNAEEGYSVRVNVAKCTNWGKEWNG